MNAQPYERLLRYWRDNDGEIQTTPSDEASLVALEARYGVTLPADFREYLRHACPIPDQVDAEVTEWWSLDRIRNIPDEYRTPIENAEIVALAPQCLFFADYTMWCMAWAICCAEGPRYGHVLAINKLERFVADSFGAFVDAYIVELGDLL